MTETTRQADGAVDLETRAGVVPGLIWAFRFTADGVAEPLPVDQPIDLDGGGWLWLHLNLSDLRAARWIADSDLPAPARACFGHDDPRQRLQAADACIFGVFSDLVRDFDGVDDKLAHLHFAMTETALISGRHHALTGAARARDEIERGGRRIQSAAGLLELIVDNLADGVDRFADSLAQRLDVVEEGLTRGDRSLQRRELGQVRRTCVRVHRELSGLRAVFHRLEQEPLEGDRPPPRIAARKLAARLDGLDVEIVELRDRARLLGEEINAATAEESNRALGILSVITAIFLPPTLVTGLFGMNVKGLPFGEEPTGFIGACIIMTLSVVVVLLVLRRLGALRF